jgi:hypothetical protein
MSQFAFNVWLRSKTIDTVFYSVNKSEKIADAIQSVRDSLINRDGYSKDIRVTWPKGQRITRDIWELQGNYGYGHGFECLCAGSLSEVKQHRKEYRENEPGTCLRIVCKRERI